MEPGSQKVEKVAGIQAGQYSAPSYALVKLAPRRNTGCGCRAIEAYCCAAARALCVTNRLWQSQFLRHLLPYGKAAPLLSSIPSQKHSRKLSDRSRHTWPARAFSGEVESGSPQENAPL